MEIDFAKGFEFPSYTLQQPDVIDGGTSEQLITQVSSGSDVKCACPLEMKLEGDSTWWEFPIEPVVSVSCSNSIVKRNVLKAWNGRSYRRGTVKELWTQGDYEVKISGVFMADSNGVLPAEKIHKLLSMCEARQTVLVKSAFLDLFGIFKVAIENYDFPFTKGMENQIFSITALSDDFAEEQLLIKSNTEK